MATGAIRIAVMTSGGDAPGMNAAVRAVVKGARREGVEVIGIRHGGLGLVRDSFDDHDFIPLSPSDVTGIVDRSGTFLKTAREDQMLAFLRSLDGIRELNIADARLMEGASAIISRLAIIALRAHEVQGLIWIGGDHTARAAIAVSEALDTPLPMIVLPASIDNDMSGTRETVGFDSAVAFAVEMVDAVRASASAHGRIYIVEVMGRTQGHIAVQVALACGAEEILVPEETYGPKELDELTERLRAARFTGRESALIIVAEGVDTRLWRVNARMGMPSPAIDLDAVLTDRLPGWETRTCILGHTQRGARPTGHTRALAARLGLRALDEVLWAIRQDSPFPPSIIGVEGDRVTVAPLKGDMVRRERRMLAPDLQLVRRLAY